MTKIIINEDQEIVETVRVALRANENYCPCKILHLPENKCMCKDFREQEEGYCHCGLYCKIKEEK